VEQKGEGKGKEREGERRGRDGPVKSVKPIGPVR